MTDGIKRLVFHRVVQGFPLIVTVGLGIEGAFARVTAKEFAYHLGAAIVTLLILIVVVLSFRDRLRLERTGKELQLQARQDALTGLPNRLLFLERPEHVAAEARRSGGRFSVLMIDLDQFKVINDTLGHGSGDSLLRSVARRLLSCAHTTDTIARLGGDEFAILQLSKMGLHLGGVMLASDIIESLSRSYDLAGQEVIIGASVGIASAPEHGVTTEQLLANADLALYRSKLAGRNGYRVFEASMESSAQERRSLELDLRHALQRDELGLVYQPVVNIATQACSGMEALLRWNRCGEIVPPAKFIPIAEDIGLIGAIGEWVLRKACNDATSWPEHLRLSVNLSPLQFVKGDLTEVVLGALIGSGLPSHRLALEVTESVLLEGSEKNLQILRSLKDIGIEIILDDFGTGYSSLTYLSMFPFNKVKIDRSFVSGMVDRRDCAAIVCSIINLAHNLDMTTVAEGVETNEQLDMLRIAGCFEAQGYLFSRPSPVCELRFNYELAVAS